MFLKLPETEVKMKLAKSSEDMYAARQELYSLGDMYQIFADDPKEVKADIVDDSAKVLLSKVVLEVLDTSPPVLP